MTLPIGPDVPVIPVAVPAATVQHSVISPTDDAARYVDDGRDLAVYGDYKIRSRYEADNHIYMMPIAKRPAEAAPEALAAGAAGGAASTALLGAGGTTQGPDTVAFVQLAAKTLLWVVDWTASRTQTPPEAPNPTPPQDSGWVLMDEHYEPVMLTKSADGVTSLYRLSGTYVYGHRRPHEATVRDVVYPMPPWLFGNFARTQPPSYYKDLIFLRAAGRGSSSISTPGTGAGVVASP